MILKDDEQASQTSTIEASLAACQISLKDYNNVIRALFIAAQKDQEVHPVRKVDSRGYPVAKAGVVRVFDGATLVAEDRGSVYAVWVNRIDEKGQTEEVVDFAEFPWKKT